ncbi:hypothetical protein PsorP6_014329 [Peronosclerospora sorghi]|uniref:Uncharacterized protein n=1 Tax=Peronosclerospora sorghi TaxID=230839 RepID=A0ACC0VH92_9STRA|nr:hypothetical protein PsorP6_014329 [Peronosclerospora sorghi]
MCRLALGDRALVPLRCCRKELPDDYVREALTGLDYTKYQTLLKEKNWKVSDLKSDADYTATVKAVGAKQCPGCGIGVQRDFGCVHMACPNGHQFCYTCLTIHMDVLPERKEPAVAGCVASFESYPIDLIDAIDEDNVDDHYVLEVYREEMRRAEQFYLDKAMAMSLYSMEEYELVSDPTDGQELASEHEHEADEAKPPPKCICCLTVVADRNLRRILLCGHIYCTQCILTRCRMGVRDRSMVPAHCCRREFPTDYVQEALSAVEFMTYERFLKEKPWRSLDLETDREYANVVGQIHAKQCPGCGIGVQKDGGCNHMTCLNGHQFCILCARVWKTCSCAT